MIKSRLVGVTVVAFALLGISGESLAEPQHGEQPTTPASKRLTVADCEKGPLEVPVRIKNLQIQCKTILARIEKSEAAEARGELGTGEVPFTRISIRSLYGDLLSAREPASTVKNHASLKNLVAMFPEIESRQSAFETTYLSCEFGLKDRETGALSHLDITWTKTAFEERAAKALHNTARCWTKGSRTDYRY